MYKLNFIKYHSQETSEQELKEYNSTPDTTATITGSLQNSIEIEVSISFNAIDPYNAILQGQKLAEDNNAEVYSITKTELIATEELLSQS